MISSNSGSRRMVLLLRRLLLILAVILISSGTAFADDVHEHEVGQHEAPAWEAAFARWEKEGYPDDIGGFYFDNDANSYGVLVVAPSPRRTSELRDLFGGDIVITQCVFPYNELVRVQHEITEMMMSNPNCGISSSGLGWTITDGAVHGFGESGKEFRVTVSVDESVFDHYYAGLTNRYGERVYIQAGKVELWDDALDGGTDTSTGTQSGGSTNTGGAAATINAPITPIEITGVFIGYSGSSTRNGYSGDGIWLWLVIGAALLGTLLLFAWIRLHPTPARQTLNGGVAVKGAVLSEQQVITAVKDSGNEPTDELLKSIMQRIDSSRE